MSWFWPVCLVQFSTQISTFEALGLHTHILSLKERMKSLTLCLRGFVSVLCAALCSQCELSVATADGCVLVGL